MNRATWLASVPKCHMCSEPMVCLWTEERWWCYACRQLVSFERVAFRLEVASEFAA